MDDFKVIDTICIYDTIYTSPTIENVELSSMGVDRGATSSPQISSDDERVVYLGDQVTDNQIELFSVPIQGPASSVIKLNGPVNSRVEDFKISPDGSMVVYRADQGSLNVLELYSVPIAGGVLPTKLNGGLTTNGEVISYKISPDSSTVVYSADQEVDTINELYSVAIDRSTEPIKLNLIEDTVYLYEITSDSSAVVYQLNTLNLYSVPIIGPKSLSVQLNGSGAVQNFILNSNNNTVIFSCDQLAFNEYSLYSVPIGGGTNTLLYENTLDIDDPYASLKITPNGAYITYIFTNDSSLNSLPNLEMSTPIPLTGGVNEQVNDYYINNTTAVYHETDTPTGLQYVYSVPIDESFLSRVELFASEDSMGGVAKINVTMDFSTVLIVGKLNSVTPILLYSVPTGGSSYIELSSNVHTQVNSTLALSADSKIVLYVADQHTAGKYELYISCVDGVDGNTKVGADMIPPTGIVTQVVISNDGVYGVYFAPLRSLLYYDVLSVTMYNEKIIRLRKDYSLKNGFFIKDLKLFCAQTILTTTLTIGLSDGYCH